MHACCRQYPGGTTGCVSLAFAYDHGLPHIVGGSASAKSVSRPAQRSLTLRPACSPSSLQNFLHQRLQPFRYLHDCSSCYRPERKLPGGFRTRWKTAPWHGALGARFIGRWVPPVAETETQPQRPQRLGNVSRMAGTIDQGRRLPSRGRNAAGRARFDLMAPG